MKVSGWGLNISLKGEAKQRFSTVTVQVQCSVVMPRQKRAAAAPAYLDHFVPRRKKPRTDPTEITENAQAVVPTPDIDVGQITADESSMLPVSGPDAADAAADAAEADSGEQEVPTEVQYNIIEGGSQRGASLLVDSNGYSYNFQRTGPTCTFWRCSRRGKADEKKCFATVQQRGSLYTRGPQDHNHHGTPGFETKV